MSSNDIKKSNVKHIDNNKKFLTEKSIFVIIAMWIARIISVSKDMIIARCLGGSYVASAFIFASNISVPFKKIFGQGVLLQVLIPIYYNEIVKNKGTENSRNMIGSIIIVTSLIMIISSILLFILYHMFTSCFINTPRVNLVIPLLPTFLIYAIITGISGSFLGILNLNKYLFLPTITPMLFNIMLIPILLIHRTESPEIIVLYSRWSIIASAVIQTSILTYLLIKGGIVPNLFLGIKTAIKTVINKINKIGLYALLSASLVELGRITPWIILFIIGQHSVATTNFGRALLRLPILLTTGIGIVSIVSFTRLASEKNFNKLFETFKYLMRQTYYIIIPIVIFTVLFKFKLVDILYGGYRFDLQAIEQTAYIALFFILEAPFKCTLKIIQPIFYAMNRSPTIIAVDVTCIFIKFTLLALSVIFKMKETGIALAMTMTTAIQYLILQFILNKDYVEYMNKFTGIITSILKGTIASLICGIIAFLFHTKIFEFINNTKIFIVNGNFINKFINANIILLDGLLYIILYLLICKLIRSIEQIEIFDCLKQKYFGKKNIQQI